MYFTHSNKSRTWLSDFPFTFHFHALEKEMATHSSVLAWRIPVTGEPGGLPSMGSHRVGHDWSDLAAAAAAALIKPIFQKERLRLDATFLGLPTMSWICSHIWNLMTSKTVSALCLTQSLRDLCSYISENWFDIDQIWLTLGSPCSSFIRTNLLIIVVEYVDGWMAGWMDGWMDG